MSDSLLLYNAAAAPGDVNATNNSYVRRDSGGSINVKGLTATLALLNALGLTVKSLSISSTLDVTATLILATGGGTGGITLTLPPAAASPGQFVVITKVDSGVGAVTLQGNASELITTHGVPSGSNTYTGLTTQGYVLLLFCDGTGWRGGQLAA